MYLRHSATCLSSITLNYVFIWNWRCLEVLLSFHFDWYLFPLVFCFLKGGRISSEYKSKRYKIKLNRGCAAMPPLLLVKERNKLGFVHFAESFLPLYFFTNPSFHISTFAFLPLDHYNFSSTLKASLLWDEGSFPLPQ